MYILREDVSYLRSHSIFIGTNINIAVLSRKMDLIQETQKLVPNEKKCLKNWKVPISCGEDDIERWNNEMGQDLIEIFFHSLEAWKCFFYWLIDSKDRQSSSLEDCFHLYFWNGTRDFALILGKIIGTSFRQFHMTWINFLNRAFSLEKPSDCIANDYSIDS